MAKLEGSSSPFLVGSLLLALACGSADRAHTSAAVGPAGATLHAGAATLTIAPNALTATTTVTLREAAPRHPGRDVRVELDPAGLALATPGLLAVRVDDSNARVRMHGPDDGLIEVEIEDRNHGSYKTAVTQLGAVEVELEHGQACSTPCGAGAECDDGACKPHAEDASAAACAAVCAPGEECDDGVCKPHGDAKGGAASASCATACATGLACDHGACRP